jgi:hypothetical protein
MSTLSDTIVMINQRYNAKLNYYETLKNNKLLELQHKKKRREYELQQKFRQNKLSQIYKNKSVSYQYNDIPIPYKLSEQYEMTVQNPATNAPTPPAATTIVPAAPITPPVPPPASTSLASPSYSCYTYTSAEMTSINSGQPEDSVCALGGNIFTGGKNTTYPGCGTCWCCKPSVAASEGFKNTNKSTHINKPYPMISYGSWYAASPAL